MSEQDAEKSVNAYEESAQTDPFAERRMISASATTGFGLSLLVGAA
jgi:hypothetical protein